MLRKPHQSYKHKANIAPCMTKNIEDYFGDGKDFGVNIEYAVSNKPLATAGQLKTAEKFIDDTFVCMYGDSVLDFSLKNMVKKHQKEKSFITMCLYEYKSRLAYGVIDTDKKGFITAWREKPEIIKFALYLLPST